MRRLLAPLVLAALALTAAAPARSDDPAPAPNVRVDVSACVVDAAVRRPVDRVTPVEDYIVETPVRGLARTIGEAHAELVPNPHCAAVDLILDGTVYSRTVGYPFFALVYTAATAPVEARYRVAIGSTSIQSVPGPVHARACATFLGATNRDGDPGAAAARLARRGFYENKEEAEAEISAHMAAQLSEQMGGELGPQLAQASEAVGTALGQVGQLGLRLQGLHFSTTCDRLRLRVRIATPGQPPPSPAPALPADADLGLRLHQSVVNEASRVLLGGKTYTPDELIKRSLELSEPLLEDRRAKAERTDTGLVLAKLLKALGQPVIITLARRDPVTVTFAGREVAVAVHAARVTVGGVKLPDMRVRAVYRLEQSAQEVLVVRKGALTIQQKDGIAVIALRPVAEALFAQVLLERWGLVRLPLPASGGPAISLRASGLSTRDGWLVAAWKLEPGAAR